MPDKKTNTTSDPTPLDKALKRFYDSYNYQKNNWHEKWDRDNKLYDNERAIVRYQGVTDTAIPLPYTTIEMMVSTLNNAEIRIDYRSTDPTRNPDVAPLNALIDEWAEDDSWDLNSEDSYRECLKIGMDANMLVWEDDHPHEITFAVRDAIIDPTVIHPRQFQEPGHYAGRRYLVLKGSLDDQKIVDPNPNSKTYGELINRYNFTNMDSAYTAPSEQLDRAKKEMFSGSTLQSPSIDQDEIIEIWDIDNVTTVKNRTQIDVQENPFKLRHKQRLMEKYAQEEAAEPVDPTESEDPAKDNTKSYEKKAETEAKGIVPFYFYRNVRKKSLFYASSEIQPIAKEVERLNDLTNIETDYLMKQAAAQRELDPTYEDWIDLIDNDPDTVYPFKPGSLQNIQLAPLPAGAFNNRQEIRATVRETTAVSEVANGAISEKDRTKFEVSSALSQTGARIESKARVFKADALYWKYWILLKLVQLYVTEPVVVYAPDAVVDRDALGEKYGVEIPDGSAIFDPADFDGDFRPRITLEVDAQSKDAENRDEARKDFSIVIQDPSNNLAEAKKIYYPKMFKLDKADIDAITTQAQPPQMPGMGAPVAAPGAQIGPVQVQSPAEEMGEVPSA